MCMVYLPVAIARDDYMMIAFANEILFRRCGKLYTVADFTEGTMATEVHKMT